VGATEEEWFWNWTARARNMLPQWFKLAIFLIPHPLVLWGAIFLGNSEGMRPGLRNNIEGRDLRILENLARAGAFAAEVVKVDPAEVGPTEKRYGKVWSFGAYSVPLCATFAEVARWR